jgi:hypothetical protein
VKAVILQCVADFVFELIDDRKVGKEREDVFYLEQIRLLQEFHGAESINKKADEHCSQQAAMLLTL